jgi:N-acetylmuramoyl-L-alanine amidase
MAIGRLQRICVRSLLWVMLTGPLALSGAAWAQQLAAAPPPARSAAIAPDTANKGERAKTRFIIGLDRHVEFLVFSRTKPNNAVVIDLPEVKVDLPQMTGDKPIGLVSSIQNGLTAPGRMRVIVNVTEPVVIEHARVETADGKPPRLVLDLIAMETPKPTAKRPFAESTIGSLGASNLAPAPLLPAPPVPAIRPRAAKSFKPVIVIDPGHGGDDTGAKRNGAVEKDVVLAFGLKLREKLEAAGRYKTLMTRETDVFVELQARREFAERNQAQLFVAVHADYAQRKARGATIYSLRESVANSLQRSAKGQVGDNIVSENQLAPIKDIEGNFGTIKEILADLARREVDATRDRTGVFVKSIIEYMGESTNLKDNPDRSAAFVVLKSAKVPSILIELGYVTNEEDAELLKSEAWREKVSASIVTAIDNYFSHQLARMPM